MLPPLPQAEARLHALGVRTAGDLAALPRPRLVAAVGAATAARLAAAASAGVDPEPVTPSGPPQSLCVEDSFKGCDSLQQLQMVLSVLGPDLQRRLQQDRARHRRTPRALLVRWRFAGGRTMQPEPLPLPLPLPLPEPEPEREPEPEPEPEPAPGARTMHVPEGAAAGRTVSRSVPMPGGAARGAGGLILTLTITLA